MSLEEYSTVLPDMFGKLPGAPSVPTRSRAAAVAEREGPDLSSAHSGPSSTPGPAETEPTEKHTTKKGLVDIVELLTRNPDGGYDVEIIPTNRFVPRRAKLAPKDMKSGDAVLILRRTAQKQRDGTVAILRVELEVQSRPLCKALRDIMRNLYENTNIRTFPIKFRAPFSALFFYRDDIKALVDSEETEKDVREDARHLQNFISDNGLLSSVVSDHNKYSAHGKVAGDILWTIFPPNSLAVLNKNQVRECWIIRNVLQQVSKEGIYIWLVTGLSVWCDGRNVGLLRRTCAVAPVTVELSTISELPLVPVNCLQDWDALKPVLSQRSLVLRQALGGDLRAFKPQKYSGDAWDEAPDRAPCSYGTSLISDGQVDERIVVDYQVYYTLHRDPEPLQDLRNKHQQSITARGVVADQSNDSDSDSDSDSDDPRKLEKAKAESENAGDPSHSVAIIHRLLEARPIIDTPPVGKPDQVSQIGLDNKEPPTGLDLLAERAERELNLPRQDFDLLFPALVPCFGLKSKRWRWVLADKLQDIDWNREAYESLQYDQHTKDLVSALIRGHKRGLNTSFDDLIAGKGQGLVFLLHGEPGLGKTLTAESVADYLEQPLYTISGGEIGTDVSSAERKLEGIFNLARRWGAVTLLDEADVLLCKRSSAEMHRNAIVAVFLRNLEYFQGVLFLTTNRRQDFDDAFRSRIHVTISYPQLSNRSQSLIWKRLLTVNKNLRLSEGWTEGVYDALGKLNLNGRTIKNLLRTAVAYAHADAAEDTGDDTIMLGLRHVVVMIETEMRDLYDGVDVQDLTQEAQKKKDQAIEGLNELKRWAGLEKSP